jgi:hypothetical protein
MKILSYVGKLGESPGLCRNCNLNLQEVRTLT